MSVNRYRAQWEDEDDNFGSAMPVQLYRVTWKDNTGKHFEFWTEDINAANQKKGEIDYCDFDEALGIKTLHYLNFESWFAYRRTEHEQQIGKVNAERGWWDKN